MQEIGNIYLYIGDVRNSVFDSLFQYLVYNSSVLFYENHCSARAKFFKSVITVAYTIGGHAGINALAPGKF